ncbi:GTP 3',8-cyclase MoaA [Telmatocola sphagniphila]|nr:GTP 3',8-cyclase MoaA [Telmatocola sphagniphila]
MSAFELPLSSSVPLVDRFGRIHNNLRISVTDRCNLRCTYCMPEDVQFLDRDELLSFEEIQKFVAAVQPLGVNKIRLTGGEPLLRRELPSLIRLLLQIPGIHDLGLSTNGLLLAGQAQSLRAAGLKRLNISLDTLDESRFEQVTRRKGLSQVLEGIQAAREAGYESIKINAVSIRGLTELDAIPLARYARENQLELRFIEYMPIGADHWEREKVFFASEILELLESEFGPISPARNYDPRSPAMDFEYADGGGRIGIIASVSRPFCRNCNRIRLTAEGKFRNCLFALDEVDVKSILRSQQDTHRLQEIIIESVRQKWEGHEINTARFVKPQRTMHAIGG